MRRASLKTAFSVAALAALACGCVESAEDAANNTAVNYTDDALMGNVDAGLGTDANAVVDYPAARPSPADAMTDSSAEDPSYGASGKEPPPEASGKEPPPEDR
jgi:hypothetical protein